MSEPFYLKKDNLYLVPITHYSMEMAVAVKTAFDAVQPAAVAVELAETMSLQLLHAASRLPDISIVIANGIYYVAEPCDPCFEALRSAIDNGLPAYCIDLDVDGYPDFYEPMPDPYAITRIGLKTYYQLYHKQVEREIDTKRELTQARRLKELMLRHDSVFYVGGMAHIESIIKLIDKTHFPLFPHAVREEIQLATLTENSCREVMAEWGFLTLAYERARGSGTRVDRQKVILSLYREAVKKDVPPYVIKNIMKYVRNLALTSNRLMPDLYQILTAAKGCADHNYAYETWKLATEYPLLQNKDALAELDLTAEEVWKKSKIIRFHLKNPSQKAFKKRLKKDKANFRFHPPSPFSICSYPPEDVIVENFGKFLQKKGVILAEEETERTIPFIASLEDGIDSKETIRHFYEKKLYVKVKGKPPGGVGSIVVIFDEDEGGRDSFPWMTTWLGEHSQESDMAFYATEMGKDVVGPGISKCRYGGFMMSYPPRRLYDVWSDPDYRVLEKKREVLLAAAIDYAVKPMVVYVAEKPPPPHLKRYANHQNKKVIYLPLGQLSPITLKKLRRFHVLDGHDKRGIAEEYIDD